MPDEEEVIVESPKGETGKTYTQAEMDKEIEARKNAERVISKQAEELKRQEASREDFTSELQSVRQEIQLVASLAAQGRPPEEIENLSASDRGDLLKQFKDMQAENQRKLVGERYLQKVKELNLTESDDDYWAIYDHVSQGRLQAADARIAKVKATQAKEPKALTEADIERLAEEKARKILEEKGFLATETGEPSGASRGFRDIEAKYIKGEIPWSEYQEARQKYNI